MAFDARADGRRICPISAPSGTGQQCGCAPASLPGMGLDGCAVAKSRCDWPLRTSIRNGAVFCWKIFGWIGGPRKASDGGSAVPLRAQYSPCARRRAGRGGLAGGPLGSTHRYAAAKLNRSPASSSSSMTTWAYRLVVLMLMYPAGSLTSATRPAPGQGDALLTHQDRRLGLGRLELEITCRRHRVIAADPGDQGDGVSGGVGSRRGRHQSPRWSPVRSIGRPALRASSRIAARSSADCRAGSLLCGPRGAAGAGPDRRGP